MADLNQIRTALLEIDIAVHNLWNLGKNMAVGWRTDARGIQVCLTPCHQVLGRGQKSAPDPWRAADGYADLLQDLHKILRTRPLRLRLPLQDRQR